MCTLHANSPAEAFDRILILGLRGGLALAERAIHILVGMAVDLIVHVRKRYDGQRTVRFVSEILEVMPPGDTDRPAVNRLFLPEGPGGRAVPAHTPSPGMLARLEAAGLHPALLDRRCRCVLGAAVIIIAALAGALLMTGIVLGVAELTRRAPAPGSRRAGCWHPAGSGPCGDGSRSRSWPA